MRTKVKPNPHLRRAREQHGWSQEALAALLGTNTFTVCRWERGVTIPSLHYRQRLCDVFATTPAELGWFDGTPPLFVDEREGTKAARAWAPEPTHCPPLPSPLIPQEQPYQHARRIVLAPGERTALVGIPGVGKTTLAAMLTHDERLKAEYPDGILWASLGLSPDPYAIIYSWAIQLGMPVDDLLRANDFAILSRRVRAHLETKRTLIILDDIWDATVACQCMVGGECCSYLITTRSPIIAYQCVGPAGIVIQALTPREGFRLLAHIAPHMTNLAADGAHELVRLVGGLPLALAILGQHLEMQAQTGQPRRVFDALERMRDARWRLNVAEARPPHLMPTNLLPAGVCSLYAAIDVSVRRLTLDARRLLMRLCACLPRPESFIEDAIRTPGELAYSGCMQALDALYDAGLVECIERGRFGFHPTISHYGALLAMDADANANNTANKTQTLDNPMI